MASAPVLSPVVITTNGIEEAVKADRDQSRDNALVLRSTTAGTAGSRTHAFLEFCVGTPLKEVQPVDVLSYAATRALVEGGWRLVVRSIDVGTEPAKHANYPVPSGSDHLVSNFAAKPHWKEMQTAMAKLASTLVSPATAIANVQGPSKIVSPFNKEAFGLSQSARYRAKLLRGAADRMGLASVPLIAPIDLTRHGYFADRGLFDGDHDDEDEGTTTGATANSAAAEGGAATASSPHHLAVDAGDATRRMSTSLASAKSVSMSRVSDTLLSYGSFSGFPVDPKKRAAQLKKKSELNHLNRRAERDKRLAGTESTTGDPGPDIKGATVFEWVRWREKHTAQAVPRRSGAGHDEVWLCLKGIVFLVDLDRVADPGRRLYYRMVFSPLYSGKDVTATLATMVPRGGPNPDDDLVDRDELDDAMKVDEDSDDEFPVGPWAAIEDAEDDEGIADHPSSLRQQKLAFPYRHRLRSQLTRAQRRHVDLVFELIRRDFHIIGVLDDRSRELWL